MKILISEEKLIVLARLLVHNNDHKSKMIDGCMFCISRAVNAIETHSKLEIAATKLIAKADQAFILESVQYVRKGLKKDAPAWMFKPEYL